jgi:heme-degrading monooxygenase HmoA
VVVRIWRTAIDASRDDEYREFEERRSLPMFREQPGFLGVLFLRSNEGAAALTLWESKEDLGRLAHSRTYLATVERLERTGLMRGDQTVEVLEVAGAHVDSALPA